MIIEDDLMAQAATPLLRDDDEAMMFAPGVSDLSQRAG
jgi:hypothetical protein